MDVQPPVLPTDHPDRLLHCAERLEPSFAVFEEAAIAAGWSPDEVAIAMLDLARARLFSNAENRKTDAALYASKRLDEIRRDGI